MGSVISVLWLISWYILQRLPYYQATILILYTSLATILTVLTVCFRVVHITGELILQVEELDSHLAFSANAQLAKLDLDIDPKMDLPSDRLIATLRQSWKVRNCKVRLVDR